MADQLYRGFQATRGKAPPPDERSDAFWAGFRDAYNTALDRYNRASVTLEQKVAHKARLPDDIEVADYSR